MQYGNFLSTLFIHINFTSEECQIFVAYVLSVCQKDTGLIQKPIILLKSAKFKLSSDIFVYK